MSRSFHLMGIGGTGMGTFAGLLQAAGHQVRGSDANVYPPMSDKLAAWGIEVREGYGPDNLDPPVDLVVVGNVIPRRNPEAQALLSSDLSYASFPQTLGEQFLADKHSIVVAGTHGKTTTTSLVAHLLTVAGQDPGMLVGGVPQNFGEGFRLGGGPAFVVEGDEYDTAFFDKRPKFVHYRPQTAVITSIEFDHADIYDSIETIEAQFDILVELVPKDGLLIAAGDSERVRARLTKAQARVLTYSADADSKADCKATRVEASQDGLHFNFEQEGKDRGRFFLPMSGRHNLENAVAAVAVAFDQGCSADAITEGLASFLGVARRQSLVTEQGGVRVLDDFAHHPTAVRRTLEGLRERWPDGRLLAVFEPRSATSSRAVFQSDYAQAFAAATDVIIAKVGRPEIAADERLDPERLAQDIIEAGGRARHVPEVQDIVRALVDEAAPGDTIVVMSNGGFGGIHKLLEAALTERFVTG